MNVTRLGDALSRFAQRFVPDPFVLALALTVVVFVGALLLSFSFSGGGGGGESTILETSAILASGWLAGFSNPALLGFALQMCLVLVTGHALAMSPPIQRGIRRLATLPNNAGGATVIVALVACLSAVIHWGLGAIVGALLAREMGRHAKARNLSVHYPLLGAAAYAGMAVWHGGLSGSAPLKVSEGDSLAPGLSLADLLLSPLNVAVTGSLIVLIPLVLFWLTPKRRVDLYGPEHFDVSLAETPTSTSLTNSSSTRWPGMVAGLVGLAAVAAMLGGGRATLDINTVILVFLFVGLGWVGNLNHYVELVAEGARGAGAIIIQFPLYFGVLGVMKASGMIGWISNGMVSVGGKTSFPLLTYASAGAVNLAVPSGGGQWAVQREILLSSTEKLGLDPVTTIMAFSYGDAWTNMLQPFWALPLLGIMGLRARDVIGYTATIFMLMAIVVPVWLVIFS